MPTDNNMKESFDGKESCRPGFERYVSQLKSYRVLEADEELDLIKKAQSGNEMALNKLITHNLRLVVMIANRLYPKISETDFEDLIQEGNLALYKAIELFDPESGFRLSTYASYWIRSSMRHEAARQTTALHVTNYHIDQQARMRAAHEKYVLSNGTSPSVEELAQSMEMSRSAVIKLQEAGSLRLTISLDSPIAEGDSDACRDIKETISDTPYDMLPVESSVEQTMLSADISEILKTLPRRERHIVALRYGLADTGGMTHTLDDIGWAFGVSKERVRQVCDDALGKLRASESIDAYSSVGV